MSIRSALETYRDNKPLGIKRGPVWTTRDGRDIQLGEMSNHHLISCWRMLDNIITISKECGMFYFHPFWGPRGEMAQEAAEGAMEQMWDKEIFARSWLPKFEHEMMIRGIKIPSHGIPKPPPEVEIVGTGPNGIGTIAKIVKA